MRLYLLIACLLLVVTSAHAEEKRVHEQSASIDTSILGVNAFANDQRFGTIKQQFTEVKNTLKIRHIRILLAWTDAVQRHPADEPFWGYYDNLINNIPRGVDALVVLASVPSWMNDSRNWVGGDPRRTFVEKWVKKVATRYKRNGGIVGYQIWNEPNMESNPENTLLDVVDSPQNYVDLLARGYVEVKAASPGKLVVMAATTAVNQNFPSSLNYNKNLRDAGAQSYTDIWAVHYYGSHYENLIFGISDFLNGVGKPVWVTESGAQGTTKQLAYAKQTWPLLTSFVPGIKRIYQYQFTEATNANSTYGLKNLTNGRRLSDLYIYLRDRR